MRLKEVVTKNSETFIDEQGIKTKIRTTKNGMPHEIDEILTSKNLWDRIVLDELGKRIVGEIKSREIIFMCAMGSLVKNCSYTSFNLLMHSESSAGKDFVTKNVLRIVPQKNLYSRTRISPTVLNYWKPYLKHGAEGWDGSILYLPDISEPVLNSDAMKQTEESGQQS